MGFRRKPERRDQASFNKFHGNLLEYCKGNFREVIANLNQETSNINPVCIFKEPLFTTKGAYLNGEISKGEWVVSPDLVVVYPCKKNWHMLFAEIKSRPLKGKVSYIKSTEIEFHSLYNYMLNYPECVYALFENHIIPGEKNKIPRSVIESCDIDFLGIYRRNRGKISKTLSCKLPPLPELLKNFEKYSLIFEYT